MIIQYDAVESVASILIAKFHLLGNQQLSTAQLVKVCYHSVHKSLCANVDIVSVYICEALLVSCILPSAWRNVQFAFLYIANRLWELANQSVPT